MMNLDILLKAAEYVENGNPKVEAPIKSRKSITKKSFHNQLEKNRRAYLRKCLETLKKAVPLNRSTRHTTLGLLNDAISFINDIELSNLVSLEKKKKLENEHIELKKKLAYCIKQSAPTLSYSSATTSASSLQTPISSHDGKYMVSLLSYRPVKLRTVSESSNGSTNSSHSSSSSAAPSPSSSLSHSSSLGTDNAMFFDNLSGGDVNSGCANISVGSY